jgi:hypothetical protein
MRACATDAPHHSRVPPCVCVRVWVWPHTYPRRNARALSVGVDRVWLGSQAFDEATTFNANIGAWNTASMATMSYVCALCHRLRVRPVRLGVGCGAALRICHRPQSTAMHAFFRASLILLCFTHFSRVYCRILCSK